MTYQAAAAPGSGHDHDRPATPVAADTDTEAGAQHANQDARPDAVVLTFSDIPSEETVRQQQHVDSHSSTDRPRDASPSASSASSQQGQQQGEQQQEQQQPQPQQEQEQEQRQVPPKPKQQKLSAHEASPAATPAPTPIPTHRVRRPSPGLAARLKALGFGTNRKPSSSPPSHHLEPVGRLPEEQLRKLDQHHLASSANTVVERRGRPWKGAIARIPSFSSLRSDKSHGKTDPEDPHEPVHEAAAPAPPPLLLPEVAAAAPLEMDTNQFRLSVHADGNGVEARPETAGAHVATDARPPQVPDSPEIPPPPPPKDTPPPSRRATNPTAQPSRDTLDVESIAFNPLGLQRPGSIYTLSRASFTNQLAQLTSLQLPDADSLSSKVSAIPTAPAAARALLGAADQIRGWISKASEVIAGLESDDDVEWAAAGGREGIEEVENAILRFEELIKVYVGAIEELQARGDIADVSPDDLRRAVAQMESILDEWAKVRSTLHNVKTQVEIAMEWEELWNMVLGDIQNEMDELVRMVFEMEERRHKSILAVTAGDGLDIGDLETIVEESPRASARLQPPSNRLSLPAFPAFPASPASPMSPSASSMSVSQEDSSLLALFARMQPLRASLDFLPMRLSVFEARAADIFPTACEELETRRAELDASYKKLERDAESLRKELGEDRWVLVFRGAGRQAHKMYESVERSVARLREAIDAGVHLTNPPAMSKKLESYEAKKTHYGPAIERVLSIIDKGVKDRLTVNGEILRLHAEMQGKWEELKEDMADLDASLEELHADRLEQQLRDSVSSMLSNDMSTLASGVETPQSSPPSSVTMSSMGLGSGASFKAPKSRSASAASASRRQSSLPTPASRAARKPVSSSASTLSVPSRESSTTPTPNRGPRPSSTLANRPRWNSSTNTSDLDTGHNFKPLTLTTPSPYAKKPPVPARSVSANTPSSTSRLHAFRSPLARAASTSPIPEDTPSKSSSRLSFRERLSSPVLPLPPSQRAPSRQRFASSSSSTTSVNTTTTTSTAPNSFSNRIASRRASLQPPPPPKFVTSSSSPGREAEEDEEERKQGGARGTPHRRPASSLATTSSKRRYSLLPQPKGKLGQSVGSGGAATGRESPLATTSTRFAFRKGSSSSAAEGKPKDARPRWRV